MLKDHEKTWNDCLKAIKRETSQQSFQTWFEPIVPYQHKQNTLTIQVPSQFFYEWIEEHHLPLLHKIINKVLGPNGQLEYVIKTEKQNLPTTSPQETAFLSSNKHLSHNPSATKNLLCTLNPTYTFDSFIEGDCNQLTKSAAQAIAKDPGKTAFNPLLIYGDLGLGKTHIAQAIVRSVKDNFANKPALYITSEKFTNQFIEALRNNLLQKFINYYATLDLLVIDDIQFLAGKEKTQDIFFNIFNHLHQSSKQIVMTSDSRPCDLSGLQKRLLSRFKWGLTTDLLLPDFETRMAITQRKFEQNKVCIENNLMEYIAASIETSIRDIEGIVTSLVAHNSLNNKPIDRALVKRLLENIISEADTELSLAYLQKTISAYYKVSIKDLKGKSKKREIVTARQAAMYLIREYTSFSLKAIGQHFGGKDHSTVVYAQKSINNLLDTDRHFSIKFETLKKIILRKAAYTQ